MSRYLCIHGHFYQPPREDPWLGEIMPEGSAAPMLNWNERITRESYTPLAFAKRLNSDGHIIELVNCYEWISFNVGPTLMRWMETAFPAIYQRIIDADKSSMRRFGHGNAIAQIYHHTILPLAKERDKDLEVQWAIQDFEKRFERKPEGMWLAECAVDTPTLETLAKHDIKFTILSPHQADALEDNGEWYNINGDTFDTSIPYRVDLPSGRSIAIFFYDAAISQAVAFEKLLSNGDTFWNKIKSFSNNGILTVSTDGETYGHHFKFGEMALAHVIDNARSARDGIELTNLAAFLASNPPQQKVRLHQPSAWSCSHGVERWRSNCGCTAGGHPEWQQEWRRPLRDAMNFMKECVDNFFDLKAGDYYEAPEKALCEYGHVLSGSTHWDEFLSKHARGRLSEQQRHEAILLLFMQEQALSGFASCAWFFDELTRIEPKNALSFALHALDILAEFEGHTRLDDFAEILADAVSNKKGHETGKELLYERILPRRESEASILLQALLLLSNDNYFPQKGKTYLVTWSNITVKVTPENIEDNHFSGKAIMFWKDSTFGINISWQYAKLPAGFMNSSTVTATIENKGAQSCIYTALPRNKRQSITVHFMQHVLDDLIATYTPLGLDATVLFETWTEGQKDQPAGHLWDVVCPALIEGYIFSEHCEVQLKTKQIACLRHYLQQWITRKQYDPVMTLKKVEAKIIRMLSDDDPAYFKTTGILERARELFPYAPMDDLLYFLWQEKQHDPYIRKIARFVNLELP
ncbi:DUF3536 domain-containing protein [Halodesulfovibrio sp.]|jgi:hypothetical protein|uniref:DUF3536 domain-containing protein n=1 Tax=Halodesulfovibrio sp. TaxID=1912772 RepID=UPI0025D401BB|nr:DUF3536 domain-containing protein [Halodesulfovibrio sp.]MCT4534226.1 DUF3536 domain-containing protein [Halodesulfovibrio sp.]MCT4625824.1 DUF3536 domain-containing protein [Halodesulfovibrio sp.]